MAIDRARYEAFARELESLREGITFREGLARIRARLLDALSRRDLTRADLPEIRRQLRDLMAAEFGPFVRHVVDVMDQALDLVNTSYADLGSDLSRSWPVVYAVETAARYELGQYSADVEERVLRAIRDATIAKETVRETTDRLRRVEDGATAYARTIAQTTIKTITRVARNEKARLADVRVFEYVGLRRRSNRPFCHVLIGQTLHIDTILALRNGNREPVIHNCGGWNCIHEWEPDPFTTVAPGPDPNLYSFLDRKRTITLPGGAEAQSRYEAAKP